MITLKPHDDTLEGLCGIELPSDTPDTSYALKTPIASTSMNVAFLATRRGPEGQVPVVVKVLRPSFLRRLGGQAGIVIRKEAVALGRLNERVPPTPFVVRLIDVGAVDVAVHGGSLSLPWIVTEHVHGGALGSTLTNRVYRSIETTGYAFDPGRAAHAISCIAEGLSAVHEMSVIHRDLSPARVLCTGSGPDEIFKISDFGVARPSGVSETLSGNVAGTPGYGAPELASPDEDAVGTWTDVFSFAGVIFFILTGEPLFRSDQEVLAAMQTPKRRSILDAPRLHPALRDKEPTCKSIDLVIGWASSTTAESRLQEALAVSAMVLPHLTSAVETARPTLRSHLPPAAQSSGGTPSDWSWTTLFNPGSGRVIRSVAWDGYGRCIAATNEGVTFWNGIEWHAASPQEIPNAAGIRFVKRTGPGRWLLGGDGPWLGRYSTGAAVEALQGPTGDSRYDMLAGDFEDIAVMLSTSEHGPAHLAAYMNQRWLRPMPVPDAGVISGIAQVDDQRWLVVGRRREGGAFAAVFHPLGWEIEPLDNPLDVPVLLTACGRPRRSLGVATGPRGTVLVWEDGIARVESVGVEIPLSASGIDPWGRIWVAGPGHVFMREDVGYRLVWHDPSWVAPFVSLYLDASLVFAVTADGAIVEGRGARMTAEHPVVYPRA